MARSSTSPRDLHDGLVERLRSGEAISSADIPPHRLSTAAKRLRREGVEVTSEKIVLNPGAFPAMVRAVYRVADAPPATNGARPTSASAGTPPKRKGPATPDIRRRLIDGEKLTVVRVMADYGCNKSILGQVVTAMRAEGYLIDAKRATGNGPATYSCSPRPMRRKAKKPKRPAWVEEAEEEEAAELSAPLLPAGPPRCPRLFSIVSEIKIDDDGGILLIIRDGDEEFPARLTQQA